MSIKVIPEDIAQFIVDKIDSVAQMEALLLLRSDPKKEWSGDALAKRLYITENDTAEILVRLRAGGLVAKKSPLSKYKYQPRSKKLRHMVDRIADVYTKNLVAVTALIHTKPKNRLQEFADAFKLRKDE
ncbi:MAG: hypothetical protein ACREQ7_00820 [Candidatus Binatia bacterium]